MFGQNKAQAALTAERAEKRRITIRFLNETLQDDVTKVDLGAILGAAELAERLGLFTHDEFLHYHAEAYKYNRIFEEKKKQENMRKAEERKAERAAKAKAAKAQK